MVDSNSFQLKDIFVQDTISVLRTSRILQLILKAFLNKVLSYVY